MDDPLFAGLYDRYYRNVLRYAHYHAEQGTAEDVASETFLIAWRRLPDVPDPALPWLLGVARKLLRKQAEAGRRRRMLTDRIAAMTSAGGSAEWDAGEYVVERDAALKALASLPERDIEVLTLVTWHALDAREAAAVLGCSPRAFATALHRARRRLSEAVQRAERPQAPLADRRTIPARSSAVPCRPAATSSLEEQA